MTDADLDVSQVTLQYSKPVSGENENIQLTYDPETEKWQQSISCDSSMERGTWRLCVIEASDQAGNLASISNSDEDLSAGDFQLWSTVTFDTRGGSAVEPQYIAPGGKAAEPEESKKDDRYFGHWYKDEALTDSYWFGNEVTGDLTLYAEWYMPAMLGIYNQSNPDTWPYMYQSGIVDIIAEGWEYNYTAINTPMNYTLPERSVTLTATPAEGYVFKGWYGGEVGDSYYVERPSEMFITDQNTFTCASVDDAACLCAVFECAGHVWEQKIQKATPDEDGCISMVCGVCGVEDAEAGIVPLLKAGNISLEGTSFTYTGKEIKPKVTVANAGEQLSEDNYTVTYSNNKNAGTATATVTLKGDYYEGSRSLTFQIKAKKITPMGASPLFSLCYGAMIAKTLCYLSHRVRDLTSIVR